MAQSDAEGARTFGSLFSGIGGIDLGLERAPIAHLAAVGRRAMVRESTHFEGCWNDHLECAYERACKALRFYADPTNWDSIEVEKISDVLSSWKSGPAVDRGERARQALGIDGSPNGPA